MFSPALKQQISEAVQEILQSIDHPELHDGEINFLLHVDGNSPMSWANIRNNSNKNMSVTYNLIRNETA